MKKINNVISLVLALTLMCSIVLYVNANEVILDTNNIITETEVPSEQLLGSEAVLDELMPHQARANGMDNHHIFPQKFRSQFTSVFGSDIIDNYTVSVPCSHHRSFSYDYNQDWQAFFNSNPNPSASDAWAFAETLAGKYGYDWEF